MPVEIVLQNNIQKLVKPRPACTLTLKQDTIMTQLSRMLYQDLLSECRLIMSV